MYMCICIYIYIYTHILHIQAERKVSALEEELRQSHLRQAALDQRCYKTARELATYCSTLK